LECQSHDDDDDVIAVDFTRPAACGERAPTSGRMGGF
jgi:hypothetical protein